ncbi:MAG: hypothetical protein AAFO82_00995 [Bacteroidota bacterium]
MPNNLSLGFINLEEHFGYEFDKIGERYAYNVLSVDYVVVLGN